MKLTLDPGAAALLDALHAAGYAAYAVGGCVRDSLLGRTAHDWDLCTSALPQQVMELFGEEQCIPTGLQHGTVTIKYGGRLYETTTFRTAGSYTDGRHPDAVQFVPDVREDLARRDFTINAAGFAMFKIKPKTENVSLSWAADAPASMTVSELQNADLTAKVISDGQVAENGKVNYTYKKKTFLWFSSKMSGVPTEPGTYTQTAKAGGNYSCGSISRTITVTADPQPAAEQPAA